MSYRFRSRPVGPRNPNPNLRVLDPRIRRHPGNDPNLRVPHPDRVQFLDGPPPNRVPVLERRNAGVYPNIDGQLQQLPPLRLHQENHDEDYHYFKKYSKKSKSKKSKSKKSKSKKSLKKKSV